MKLWNRFASPSIITWIIIGLIYPMLFHVFSFKIASTYLQKQPLNTSTKFTGEHPCRNMISIKLLCNCGRLLLKPGSEPEKPGPRLWNRTLINLDPEKPGPWKTWTLNNLDPQKHGSWKTWNNMWLKSVSDFRELCFKRTMHNVICRWKVHRYLN